MPRCAAFICVSWLAWAGGSLGAAEQMMMKVSPTTCFSPGFINVRITVERHASNRALEIVAESAEFYRSSSIQLDGENAPRTHLLQYRNLPPGEYLFDAILTDSAGKVRAAETRHVMVITSGVAR